MWDICPQGCEGENMENKTQKLEDVKGTEEYLLARAIGRTLVNNKVYHQVSEYWWDSDKPESVDKEVRHWRDIGYYACSRYKVVRSGTSWNNGPNDMRLYSVYASYKKEALQ